MISRLLKVTFRVVRRPLRDASVSGNVSFFRLRLWELRGVFRRGAWTLGPSLRTELNHFQNLHQGSGLEVQGGSGGAGSAGTQEKKPKWPGGRDELHHQD